MDNKTVKTIVNIVVGVALLTMIYSFISLIFNAITARDAILLEAGSTNNIKNIVNLVTYMLVALVCLLVPTLVCYGFALFGKNKIMTIVSAVMSLFVVATCLALFFVLREEAFTSTSAYTIAAAAFTEIIQLCAATAIMCAFFTFHSVTAIKEFFKKPEAKADTSEQIINENKENNENEEN